MHQYLRALAKGRIPKAIFDYADGAYEECTLPRNAANPDTIQFRQRVMVDVSEISTAATLVGTPTTMPLPNEGTRGTLPMRGDPLRASCGCIRHVSERMYQTERGGTWDKVKGCDSFGPIGPWLVTADEVGDPQQLRCGSRSTVFKNKRGSTSTTIFDVATIVSYLSEFMTPLPGDVITTGTPPSVGMRQKPIRQYLRPGDVVTLGIEKLGSQRQTCIAWTRDP